MPRRLLQNAIVALLKNDKFYYIPKFYSKMCQVFYYIKRPLFYKMRPSLQNASVYLLFCIFRKSTLTDFIDEYLKDL